MLRSNSLARLQQKRTLRGLYIWHEATPHAAFLDTTNVPTTTIVYPGMVASKTTGEQMKVSDANDVPFGLFGNFINGAMDELGGGTEIGVWRGGPNAMFEVVAGPSEDETPLDPDVNWTALNATANVGLYSDTDGRLTVSAANGGTADANSFRVARLVEAVSNSKITITLDLQTAAGL